MYVHKHDIGCVIAQFVISFIEIEFSPM